MNKKLVVLTGSFNPVTKAHFQILSDAVEKLNADKGLFVATSNEYLINKTIVKAKSRTPFILSESVRQSMLETLNDENPKLFFGGFEMGGASPKTNSTLKKIMKDNKGFDLYYLCGADKLHGISRWNDADKMLSSMHLVVYRRSDIDVDMLISSDPFLLNYKDRIIILDTNESIANISSTELRNRFFNNLDYKELMNDGPYQILNNFKPSDFKKPSAEEVIKYTILYGGRFGGNTARTLVYKDNVKLFNNWDESKFGNRVDLIKGTKVYKDEFKVNSGNNYVTEFECKNIDCALAAQNLITEGLNPAILNLASNVQPCGGYDKGSGAQEESLCYMSTLSQSLYQFGNPKKKYFKDANLENVPGVYPMDINYGGIYSPNVCFFRNNIDSYYSLRDKPFKCAVISVASLANRGANEWTDNETKYFDDEGYLTKEGKEIEKNKIKTICRIALDNNHDSLILGAFGCGVYNLKCDEVATLFHEILNETEFKNKFKKIVFAIFEGKGSSRKIVGAEGKFKSFYDLFNRN